MKHPKSVGEKTQAIVLAELVKRDKVVLTPFGDNQPFDFVVCEGNKFNRLQCKTGKLNNGVIRFNTCSNSGNRKQPRMSYLGKIESFIVYCYENNKTYLVPIENVGKTEFSMRIDALKNKRTVNINWAADYELK
jgi:hypothetical protein